MDMKESLFEFNERTDYEAWKGLSSAYRNGAKCRLLGSNQCNYTFRRDFKDAWCRGWNMMDSHLKKGHQVYIESEVEVKRRKQATYSKYKTLDTEARHGCPR